MKIFAVLLCGLLQPMRCAPVIDEAPTKHNHTNVRDQRLFSSNTFDSGDIDVSGQVHGHDVSIGSSVDIEVGQSGSKSPPAAPEVGHTPAPVVQEPTGGNEPGSREPGASWVSMPKGPQGPDGAVLQYDLLSNSQSGIHYPWGNHVGAFIPRTRYHPENGELEIYLPSSVHQDSGTNEVTLTAAKYEDGWHYNKITSGRMDTKGVWTTAQSDAIKNRGYVEVRALMPASSQDSWRFKGAWPAIWMLGADGRRWPNNGEIDIVELINGVPKVYMSTHSTHHYGGNAQHPPNNPFWLDTDMTQIPVIFGLEWNVQADRGQIDLTWWITYHDNPSQQWKSRHTTKSLFKYEGDADYSVFFDSFNGPGFYLLINLAQGGNWPGEHGASEVLNHGPQHVVVQSAKVYRIEDSWAVDEPELPGSYEATVMPNIGYVFRGYDIMKGNPLPATGLPVDPGFREPIFKATYESGSKTPDRRYLQPDGTSVQDCTGACSLNFESKEMSGARSYQDSLSVKASVSVEGSDVVWSGKFSASTGYNKVEEGTSSESNLYTQSTASCCSYWAQILSFKRPPLSDNFKESLGSLPEDYDEEAYLRFIDAFGTHIISETQLGALFGQQSEISSEAWSSMQNSGLNVKVGASLSAYGNTGSAKFMTNEEKKKAEEFKSKSTSQRLITIGAPPPSDNNIFSWVQEATDSPAPMAVKLNSILDLFDSDEENMMYALETWDCWSDCATKRLSAVKANLKKALTDYCSNLKNMGVTKSCSAPGPDPPFPGAGGSNGEQVCEGHNFGKERCESIGCCHYDDGQCWSSVGTGSCVGGSG